MTDNNPTTNNNEDKPSLNKTILLIIVITLCTAFIGCAGCFGCAVIMSVANQTY